MMPATFRAAILAVERQAGRFYLSGGGVSRIFKHSARSLSQRLTCAETWPAKHYCQSFASAALSQETRQGEQEDPRSQSHDSQESWLQIDPAPASSVRYSPEDELASSDGEADCQLSDEDVPALDNQREDLLGPLNWSDAEEEPQERQSRFSPHGPQPKLKWPREKVRKGIGKQAVIPPLPAFNSMVPRLQAYKEKFGDCLVPKRYWEDFELGSWTHRIRTLLKDKKLPVRQFDVLDKMGFPWQVPMAVAAWEFMYHEMRRYKEEYGNLEVPFKWKDPMADFNNHFAKWFHTQPTLFLQRRLRPDQVRKLMIAGYDMRSVTGDDVGKADYLKAQKEISMKGERSEFEIMFVEMEAWKATYYTTIIPRMVYDNPVLGMWAWKMRRDHRKKRLAQWKVDRLSAIEFLWDVDQQASKWHTNLHEARRYKEVHGTGNIPLDYRNPAEPGWQEAGRWLQRQAKLFRKQKLTDKRYRILREVLGIKFVRQYAPRVHLNRKRMGIVPSAEQKRLPKYGTALQKNMLV